MNLASWIILAIVIAAMALAIRATFFSKKRSGDCCDVGDARDDLDLSGLMCSGCDGCSASKNCAAARNNLQPVYKPLQ